MARGGTGGGGAGGQGGERVGSVVDWKGFEKRAWVAWRDVGGKVVEEAGALEAARAGGGGNGGGVDVFLWRDFLRGKIFVGRGEPVEGVVCLEVKGGVERLLEVVPGLESVLGSPGDKRVRMWDGQVVVEGKGG